MAFGVLIHESYGILIPGAAQLPVWFPFCCFTPRVAKPNKVTSIFGLKFTPSEQAYYTGSVLSPPRSSLGSGSSGSGTSAPSHV